MYRGGAFELAAYEAEKFLLRRCATRFNDIRSDICRFRNGNGGVGDCSETKAVGNGSPGVVCGNCRPDASAHHSNAEYGNTLTTMHGTIVEYRRRNSSCHRGVGLQRCNRQMVRWRGELASITTAMEPA
jgi:hypothetical protein